MRSLNIALIEDESECSEDYEALLADRGHTVMTYKDADDVIADIDFIATFDRVVLDLMMRLGSHICPSEAEETGIAIYKRLRSIAPELPVIVITARSREEVWHHFISDARCRFLGKPVSNLTKFLSTIEEWSSERDP